MIVLLKLLMAHLVGDFLLQPASWVKAKEEKKLLAWQLYAHALIHGVVVLIILWDRQFILWACLIVVVHLIIDAAKSLLQNRKNQRWLFFIDQLLHFISIYAIWLWYENEYISFSFLKNEKIILLITLLIFLTRPVSIACLLYTSDAADDL